MRIGLQAEFDKYNFSLPILRELGHRIRYHAHFKDMTIGWHCHLTEITAAAARVALDAGARLFFSECDPHTTNAESVEYLREAGATVYLGADSTNLVLAHKPVLLADTGFALIAAYLAARDRSDEVVSQVYAASEITGSGITQLRSTIPDMPIPVVNINGTQLKTGIENFHGVGDGVVDLLSQMSWRMWAGRPAAVAGYGVVGSGVCHYLRRLGCHVVVVENDPVRQLIAHYDGYALDSLENALASSQLLVTATGKADLIAGEDLWKLAADGLLVVNVGHRATEVNLPALHRVASDVRQFNEFMQEYTLRDSGRLVYIATGGSPANVVMLSGSPEPTLIHLTTEILCMNYLAGLQQAATPLAPGEMSLPPEIEQQASVLALKALKIIE